MQDIASTTAQTLVDVFSFAPERAAEAVRSVADPGDVAACVGNCSGNGLCAGGVCHCHSGWAGTRCAWDSRCPNFCFARGHCSAAGECKCENGYSGLDCSVAPSCYRTAPCVHGECLRHVCHCWMGWEGASCANTTNASALSWDTYHLS